jgi:hypothetical protein
MISPTSSRDAISPDCRHYRPACHPGKASFGRRVNFWALGKNVAQASRRQKARFSKSAPELRGDLLAPANEISHNHGVQASRDAQILTI